MRLLLPSLVFALTAQSALAQFEAHEWGTFTSLVGSNGITQNGMYHEDEPLPPFVHAFGVTQADLAPRPAPTPQPAPVPCHRKFCPDDATFFDRNVITQKMETPVIYFHSDVARSLDVNVRFPEGVVTETFPAPTATSPTQLDLKTPSNGNTTFHVDVLAPDAVGTIPAVEEGNIYSHARTAVSNLVRSGAETEKFIFYRGIGRFQPRMAITSQGGKFRMAAAYPEDLPLASFLVHVDEKGDGRLTPLYVRKDFVELSPDAIDALEDHTGAHPSYDIYSGEAAHEVLASALSRAGLNPDEADAMVNTWENGYLKVPGLRLLYILPRGEVDTVLPLTITPAPEKLTRVFVGRIEVMLDTEEHSILNQVTMQGRAFRVATLGRFAEAKLRRVREVYVGSSSTNPLTLAALDDLIQEAAHGDDGPVVN